MNHDEQELYQQGRAVLEQETWTVLERAGEALTAAEVQRRHQRPIAYSTVATVLSRLHSRGDVFRSRHGRAYRYAPSDDAAGVAARAMRRALDITGHDDRSGALARFVGELDTTARLELCRVVAAMVEYGEAG